MILHTRAARHCLLLILLAFAGCKSKKSAKPQQEDVASLAKGSVRIVVSIDWEGAFLDENDLASIVRFQKEWPDLRLTHFVCPAYFTRRFEAESESDAGSETEADAGNGDAGGVIPPGYSSPEEAAGLIQSVVREGDEVGLHLHAWHSLVQSAGVEPKSEPNYFGDDRDTGAPMHGDPGYAVSLLAYSDTELDAILTSATQELVDRGFPRPTSFRAAGFVGGPRLLSALVRAGYKIDSSSIWHKWLPYEEKRFQIKVAESWPNLQEFTQPYGIDTPAGPIYEVPNTGSFPEFVSFGKMSTHAEQALSLSAEMDAPVTIGFGFHAETASEHLKQISDVLFLLREENPDALEFVTATEAVDLQVGGSK